MTSRIVDQTSTGSYLVRFGAVNVPRYALSAPALLEIKGLLNCFTNRVVLRRGLPTRFGN
jgi:hypothetical protein